MELVKPFCNLGTLADDRGGIFTWALPKETAGRTIKEFNLIQTNKGEMRGFHYHKEFVEWILVTSGQVVYFEYVPRLIQLQRVEARQSQYPFEILGPGDCICFPIGTGHTMKALTDLSMVAMIDKRWDDCEEPITPIEFEPLEMEHKILREIENGRIHLPSS